MSDFPRASTKPTLGQRLNEALAGSEPLAGLMDRVRSSRQRFDAIAHLLPEALRASVRPGPLDDTAWLLLATNAASAAKLRQMLPDVQAALLQAGWQGPDVKVKIQPKA